MNWPDKNIGSTVGRHHLSCTAPHIVTFRGVITIFDRGHSQQATIDEPRVNMKRTAAVRRSLTHVFGRAQEGGQVETTLPL
jgi:hypothetical protein